MIQPLAPSRPRLPRPVSRILLYGWLARPHFVAGSAVVYLTGDLVARSETHALNGTTLALGLAAMWLVQIATHFFNEYYDRPSDSLNVHRTFFSGGSGVLQSAQLSARSLPWAGVSALVFAVGLLLALAAWQALGWTPLVVFGLALLGAVSYSVPPVALANRGWGELDTSLVAGLLTPLFGYSLQTGGISLTAVRAALPLAALVLANMINVAFPDYAADRAVGKRTLVVLLGPERAARCCTVALLSGYAAAWLAVPWSWPGLLALAAAFPFVALSLYILWRGGYRKPHLFDLNTFLGIAVFGAVTTAEALAFLFAGLV